MRYLFLIALWAMLTPLAAGDTIHVPGNQPTIQEGINAAQSMDTVLVAPGTYIENLYFKGKAINVVSSHGPSVTELNANQSGSVVYFQMEEGPNTLLSGFTIRNGVGTREAGGWVSGGGIYCIASSPCITYNILSGNAAEGHGAGIACLEGSAPTITNNIFYNNINGSDIAEGWGGAIGCRESSAVITDNLMLYNSASYAGGGVFSKECPPGYPIIENNDFRANEGKIRGGGLYISYCESVIVANNTFSQNTSPTGGGFHYTNSTSSLLVNNTFYRNSTGSGSGWGGGLFCNAEAELTVANTILWENAAMYGSEIYLGSPTKPSTMTISYSDVYRGLSSVQVANGSTLNWGASMIDVDPLFVNPVKYDFHLTHTSACLDAGTAMISGVPTNDFEGDLRPAHAEFDMGADEFDTHIYYIGHAYPGSLIEFSLVGTPGTQPIGFWLSIRLLSDSMPTQWGDWYLDMPIIGPVLLDPIPSPGGVLTLPTTIPPDSPAPLDLHVQAMIGNELSNLCTIEIN